MASILALMMAISSPETNVDNEGTYPEEAAYELFWPPDMVPHPMPPTDDGSERDGIS